MGGSAGRSRKASAAGPMRRSMRSPNPASSQWRRPMLVHSSLTSRHNSRPPGASPRAMLRAEYPVNVPTSTAKRAPTSCVSSVISAPCSGAICIPLTGPSASVAAISDRCTSSSGGPWATRYSWTSRVTATVFGSAMRSTVHRARRPSAPSLAPCPRRTCPSQRSRSTRRSCGLSSTSSTPTWPDSDSGSWPTAGTTCCSGWATTSSSGSRGARPLRRWWSTSSDGSPSSRPTSRCRSRCPCASADQGPATRGRGASSPGTRVTRPSPPLPPTWGRPPRPSVRSSPPSTGPLHPTPPATRYRGTPLRRARPDHAPSARRARGSGRRSPGSRPVGRARSHPGLVGSARLAPRRHPPGQPPGARGGAVGRRRLG